MQQAGPKPRKMKNCINSKKNGSCTSGKENTSTDILVSRTNKLMDETLTPKTARHSLINGNQRKYGSVNSIAKSLTSANNNKRRVSSMWNVSHVQDAVDTMPKYRTPRSQEFLEWRSRGSLGTLKSVKKNLCHKETPRKAQNERINSLLTNAEISMMEWKKDIELIKLDFNRVSSKLAAQSF